MSMPDVERLKKIVRTWDAAERQIASRGITRELLLEDEFLQWALTAPLYNIGEQVYKLSPEIKARYSELPWNVVAGMRHRLVHDYEGVNWSIIVEIIFDEMPGFVEQVKQICADTGSDR